MFRGIFPDQIAARPKSLANSPLVEVFSQSPQERDLDEWIPLINLVAKISVAWRPRCCAEFFFLSWRWRRRPLTREWAAWARAVPEARPAQPAVRPEAQAAEPEGVLAQLEEVAAEARGPRTRSTRRGAIALLSRQTSRLALEAKSGTGRGTGASSASAAFCSRPSPCSSPSQLSNLRVIAPPRTAGGRFMTTEPSRSKLAPRPGLSGVGRMADESRVGET